MSREINNSEYRQNIIRELLAELHGGSSVEDVKAKFEQAFSGVSATEISAAEQALIEGGMSVEEVQRLCDVHAAVFKDTLVADAPGEDAALQPGHPAHTLREENRALEQLIERDIKPELAAWLADATALPALRGAIKTLGGLGIHYVRKENLLFPYMERHGITAPPKVMWGVDDEIRAAIKQVAALAQGDSPDKTELATALDELLVKISEMIFKEENIMLPMLLDALTPAEWGQIAAESDELGYFLISTPPEWAPPAQAAATADLLSTSGSIVLPTGVLELTELTRMLDMLPIDITFVDKDDKVKYFSQAAERIFPRTRAIIGRDVSNCHPPASVHIVEGILADFKSGKKNSEDFWISMGDKFIYIRYFAVRGDSGEYMGTLEVTQNIAPIQGITGEKRLVEA